MKQISLLIKTTCLMVFLALSAQYVQANIVIKNGLTHIHEVSLGKVYKGKIELQNTTDQLQSVKIYQKDYQFYHTGEAIYDAPQSNKRSNAHWINLSNNLLTLNAKETTVINYEIQVPSDLSLPGTTWSVIMVEGIPNIEPNEFKAGLNISTIMRYAVQIATTLEDTGSSELNFLNVDLNKSTEGKNQLELDVKNIGERLLIPTIELELFDQSGQAIGLYKATKKKTYPGTSVKFFVDLATVPAGDYQAVLLADCQDEEVFGVNISLSITNE